MKAKFFCKTGLLAGRKYEITREATIGKDSGNSIVLDTKIISGQHARITFDDAAQCYFLEDRQSRNGTRLDGLPVTEKEKLGDLHVITFAGKFDFIFQLTTGEASRDGRSVPFSGTKADLSQTIIEAKPEAKTRYEPKPATLPKLSREEKPAIPAVRARDETKLSPEVAPLPDLRAPEKSRLVPDSPSKTDPFKTVVKKSDVTPPTHFDEEKRPSPAPAKTDLLKTVVKKQDLTLPTHFDEGLPSPQKTIIGRAPSLSSFPELPVDKESSHITSRQKPLLKRSNFFLEIKRIGQDVEMFELFEGENIVGRAAECQIRIEDASISRQHAIVKVAAGKVLVKDLESKNRTFIGNTAIAAAVEIRLDTKLKFGAVEAHLVYIRK